MAERDIQTDIRLALGSRLNITLFRNNTGVGWVGDLVRKYNGGAIELKNTRPLYAGLCNGSSDLIGWTSVIITPDMVGRKVAVFSAIEVKDIKGKAAEDQKNFLEQVRAAGGYAGACKSSSQAVALLSAPPGVAAQ